MTQEELGKKLGGIGKSAVQKIESGRTSMSVDKLVIICETFKVLPAHILYETFPVMRERLFGLNPAVDSTSPEAARRVAEIQSLAESKFGPRGVALLYDIYTLNDKGTERAIAYVGDLMKIKEYRKQEQTRSEDENLIKGAKMHG